MIPATPKLAALIDAPPVLAAPAAEVVPVPLLEGLDAGVVVVAEGTAAELVVVVPAGAVAAAPVDVPAEALRELLRQLEDPGLMVNGAD